MPERATARKHRGEKSAEVVVAKSKPGRRYHQHRKPLAMRRTEREGERNEHASRRQRASDDQATGATGFE